MTSVQERLQIKRTALDKWSIKERLCLASAVHCSGDQNWMSVSRSIKLLCGTHNRPPDWFSQKSCAVQYGELLESVETPKRKKRTNSDNQNQPAETPTESILRNLKQERIAELENLIRSERENYIKIHKQALSIQNNTVTEDQLREMWHQIQKEKEEQVAEEQKYNEWLKEREQRKLELQRAWRPSFGTILNTSSTQAIVSNQNQQAPNLKHEDMEIDETITPNPSNVITPTSSKSQPTATSPLLTSLLKTPSPTIGSASVVHTTSTTSARVQAPTITNLLTGGQLPPNVSNNQQYKINHPLTGPPIHMTTVSQVAQSPSQSAPTLSMLLESKNSIKETKANVDTDIKKDNQEHIEQEGNGSDSPNKDELMEVFKGLIDENMDELAEILNNANAIIPEILDETLGHVDLDEQLEGQEKNLLEDNRQNPNDKDSKNLNITVASDKGTQAKTILDSEELMKNETRETSGDKINISIELSSKEEKVIPENPMKFITAKQESHGMLNSTLPQMRAENPSFRNLSDESFNKDDKKSDMSEDSGDMTFQEIANEIKEKIKAEEGQDSKESSEDVMDLPDNIQSIQSIESDDKKSIYTFEDSQDAQLIPKNDNLEKLKASLSKNSNTKKTISESSDVIIIPEDEDSSEKIKNEIPQNMTLSSPNIIEKKTYSQEKGDVKDKFDEIKPVLKSEFDRLKKMDTTTITIIDTDDDSTHTDSLIRDEKMSDSSPKNGPKNDLFSKADSDEKKLDKNEDSKSSTIEGTRATDEQDDSESAAADDDFNDSLILRTRRRFSSTPAIDSVPNSPASSSDISDQRAIKKSLLTVYNKVLNNKYSNLFVRIPNDSQLPIYKDIVLHPMDLATVKKNIEIGVLKSLQELQRDLMLICVNNIMFYEANSEYHSAAKAFLSEIRSTFYKIFEKEVKIDDIQDSSNSLVNVSSNSLSLSGSSSSNSVKIRPRKSQRF